MKKKVAAYCRVSTKEDIQQYSLEAQKKYYQRIIEQNQNYEFVGVYADTSSGLRKKNRVQFEKLLRDCKRGKIDIIFYKIYQPFFKEHIGFFKGDKGVKIYRSRYIFSK